jgi:hypothetical protein
MHITAAVRNMTVSGLLGCDKVNKQVVTEVSKKCIVFFFFFFQTA